MARFVPVDPFDIVIFGGTGDLSRRKLLPALYHRWLDGQIPENSAVVATARSDIDTAAFRKLAKEACQSESGDSWSETEWVKFEKLVQYITIDATDPKANWAGLRKLLKLEEKRPRVFYLATSPHLYVDICRAIGSAGLAAEPARVVLEKPIGTDLDSARAINDGVGEVFSERQVFRIDHYLGKETVQNLMVLRFANMLFEPLWSHNYIDHVQITVAENLGLEGRAEYYDRSGALRDMVQNHMLQLLCLTAMEPPNNLGDDDIRTEKIKVLNALSLIGTDHVRKQTVRGQYTAGIFEGKPVKGYLEELSSASGSSTETFVAIKAEIKNWRWAGVPFYLRTGKRMSSRHSDIVIQFKAAPHNIFGQSVESVNRLVIRLQPDEAVRLFVQIKEPGPGGLRVKSLPLNLSYAESFLIRYPDAYERLLMDIVRGNLSLFMRRDEVEAAWRWVDGLIDAWDASGYQPEPYSSGTDGPLSAALMTDRDGRSWWKEG
ncbi:MAG: glucose-6-phosphate dehydrogenase [Hyphomonas sp.]|uniref:glucose-6-phosphate dehydrogenase n=1 Tax=Hyphomonas sp. TaxID=87 RepID=UPI00184B5195|nr:glucose-6-phosphate dehydrogenase [Hyphomonas sp.]MBA3069631.1 glucose-6-phosphate dehydrogenase [Hyphomonas sp.]MBU4062472.1 glucose-6-phosphate dehydrogenase [Alphaproteobacteria bacterium]MBU4163823.1 glucose-6-phosphate dehydrogenase [Alphaproteobacteria bacterium]